MTWQAMMMVRVSIVVFFSKSEKSIEDLIRSIFAR